MRQSRRGRVGKEGEYKGGKIKGVKWEMHRKKET
jgi:hypothetical protein